MSGFLKNVQTFKKLFSYIFSLSFHSFILPCHHAYKVFPVLSPPGVNAHQYFILVHSLFLYKQ
jgi:hypothetical protein